jgi:hypothetical protein
MAYPYTPAQLAAFRSALAVLAEGVLQGDLVVAEQSLFVAKESMPQASDDVVSSKPEEMPESEVFANPIQSFLPDLKGSSKPKAKHILSRLSWFSKKPEAIFVPPDDLFGVDTSGEAIKSTTAQTEIVRDYPKDTRIVSSYFSGLPWAASKDKIDNLIDGSGAIAELRLNNAVNLLHHQGSFSAKIFFSELPWFIENHKKIESPVATGLEPRQEQVGLGHTEKTITIDRIVDKPLPINEAVADVYFSALPWFAPKEASTHTQSVKAELQKSIPYHQAVQLESPQLSELAKPMGGYFQALPWQTKPVTSGVGDLGVSEASNEGIPSIFVAATHSALRAAEKVQTINGQPTNKRTDKFFSLLPWNGNP